MSTPIFAPKTPTEIAVAAAKESAPLQGELLQKNPETIRFNFYLPGINYVFRSGKIVCAIDGTYATNNASEIAELMANVQDGVISIFDESDAATMNAVIGQTLGEAAEISKNFK